MTQSLSYSLFYGSILDIETSFTLRMYEYQHALDKAAIFIPRIITFECPLCPDEIKAKHCVSDGWYCFTPPRAEIADMYPELTDESLIRENLRERCIYEIIGEMEDEWDDHMFWNYLYSVRMVCLKPDHDLGDDCADYVMDEIKIPKDKVYKCMDESFGTSGDWNSYNGMLYRDREVINDLGTVMNPSMTINSHPYTDELRGEKVFAAICAAYHIGLSPDVCNPDYDI